MKQTLRMKNNKYKIVAITISWNSIKYIDKCIVSLLKSNYPIEIIVVDNNSSDGTELYLKNKYPTVTVIQSGANLGVTGANNLAIKKAIEEHADYIFLLNPDAYIDPNCINKLLEVMKKDLKIGMACPMIYNANKSNRIWFAGSIFDWHKGIAPHIGYNEIDKGQYFSNTLMDRVCSCAVLISIESLLKIGLFDDNYFLYFDETDLSIRYIDKGYKLLFVSNAKCWHAVSASSEGDDGKVYLYYMTRNNLVFMNKHRKQYFNIFIYHFFVRSIITCLILIKVKKIRAFKLIGYIFRAIYDYYFNNLGKQI